MPPLRSLSKRSKVKKRIFFSVYFEFYNIR
jgi:hypothetical protein